MYILPIRISTNKNHNNTIIMSKRTFEELTQGESIKEEDSKRFKCEDITTSLKSVVTSNYPTGEVDKTTEYVDGRKHGCEITYDKIGRLLYSIVWENDLRVKEINYWDSGLIKSITSFKSGNLQESYLNYNLEGNITQSSCYVYYDNGELEIKTNTTFNSDVKPYNDIHTYYRKDGTIRLEKQYYRDSIPLIWETTYDKEGAMKHIYHWYMTEDHDKRSLKNHYSYYSNGNGKFLKRYDEDGCMYRHSEYLNNENNSIKMLKQINELTETTHLYYSSNKIKSETIYQKNTSDVDTGVSYNYPPVSQSQWYRTGELKSEFYHKNDTTVSKKFYKNSNCRLEKKFTLTGEFISEDTFTKNGKRKTAEYYDAEGDYITAKWYKNGQLRWHEAWTKLNQLIYSKHYDREGNLIDNAEERWP